MTTRSAERAEVATEFGVDVAAILRHGDVRLHFQPIVELASGRVVAVEALARFPDHASPLEVFGAAQDADLSAELEALVLRRAMHERIRVPADVLLSINVTPGHLLGGPVAELLAPGEVAGLVLELTEDTAVPDPDVFGPVLDKLRRDGALIALDDTGAGYQGLQQVASLRPDWVKIDRTVVTGSATDEVRRASLQMFTRVARRVGAVAVAEGVESAADVDVLRELDIPLAQGYFFGAPSAHPRARTHL